MTKTTLPYGSWPSPITAQLVASASPTIDLPSLDQGVKARRNGSDKIYWLESRPDEAGRNAIVCQNITHHGNEAPQQDVLPAPYSARSRVHEYGGNCYMVIDQILYFVAQDDQRIYRLELGSAGGRNPVGQTPVAITPANQGYRFADFCYDQNRDRLLCVGEQHLQQTVNDPHREPKNFIAAISLRPSNGCHKVEELVSGADFYAYPRISPDNKQLCWLSWNHPSMPWYGTELWLANLDQSGRTGEQLHIAGSADESIFQPQWSASGSLYFVSDRYQWWNLYRYEIKDEGHGKNIGKNPGTITPICPMPAEFATPLWTLGMSTYVLLENNAALLESNFPGGSVTSEDGPISDDDPIENKRGKANSGGKIACCYSQNGLWEFALIDIDNGELTTIETPYSHISAITGEHNQAWFVAASPDTGNQLVHFELNTGRYRAIGGLAKTDTLTQPPLNKAMFSQARVLSFTTSDGGQAHGFFYPPHNLAYQAPDADRAPLIVICHGGPTGATNTALNLKIQFWTSRGFAVLDINYRGSTGYGRPYRELLDKQWGEYDVDDVLAGAKHLIEQGLVDPDKLAIRGSSAGGYTVLSVLAFHDLFSAGASYYGIGDLETLAKDTHKFESQYLERLVGPYPKNIALYQARSPVNHIEKLTCPVIFFQGLDDKVMPPDQAEAMVLALSKQGLSSDYVTFRGEGHGFRKAENIAYAMGRELVFYSQVFGFELPASETENHLANAPSNHPSKTA